MISCSVKSLLEDVKVSAMVMSISASFGLEIWKLFVSCIYHLGIICFMISSSIDGQLQSLAESGPGRVT